MVFMRIVYRKSGLYPRLIYQLVTILLTAKINVAV